MYMHKICLAMIMMFSARGFAAATHNLQQAECFPDTAEAKDWPVQTICLAGLAAIAA